MKKYKSRDAFIADFELLYNNCLTYNGPSNYYTNTAQKLLSVCSSSCNSEYRDQLQQLEDMALQDAAAADDDDNSESGYNLQRSQSSINTDAITDSESNFEKNDSEKREIKKTSSNSNLPIPMMTLSKQLKTLNKKISTNQKNRISHSSTPNMKQQASARPSTSGSVTKKNKEFFFPKIQNHKDSPRSGSDADVFVDVESIDDRGYSLQMLRDKRKMNDGGSERGKVEMSEYDDNPYNEDF